MTEPKKDTHNENREGLRDHAEQYPTENESLFDKFESEHNVDPLPVEDLNLEQQEEKKRNGESKSASSSDRKYRTGF